MTNTSRVKWFVIAAVSLLAIVILMRAAEPAFSGDARARHVVEIRNLVFTPAALVVSVGDTIVWRNADLFPHSATSDRQFDTREIAAGDSATIVATARGEYRYICKLHPSMTASLTVR